MEISKIAAILILLVVVPAQAQACMARDAMLLLLAEYNEAPAQMGMTPSGQVIELYTSPEGDTWTIVMTTPDGISCPIAAGEAWIPVPVAYNEAKSR